MRTRDQRIDLCNICSRDILSARASSTGSLELYLQWHFEKRVRRVQTSSGLQQLHFQGTGRYFWWLSLLSDTSHGVFGLKNSHILFGELLL